MFARSNQFSTAPRASAPDYTPSARDALEGCVIALQEETLDYFEEADTRGWDMPRLIAEALRYDAGVKERQRAAKRAKAAHRAAHRLVRILTGAMNRAMMQGDTDLAEDLASAVRRNVTVWADAYHESY